MTNNIKNLRSEIVRFLRNNGWSRKISKAGDLVRYMKDDKSFDKPVYIYFSIKNVEKIDSSREVNEALAVIRQYYGMPFAEVRHRMSSLSSVMNSVDLFRKDSVTSRVPDKYVFEDTIDISIATATVSYLRSLIEGAVAADLKDSIKSQAYVSNAKNYAKGCRFGHTFRGSFGFLVECPLEEPVQLAFDIFDADVPLGRRVSERIATGLSSLSVALKDDRPDIITNAVGGLSARMCKQLADYIEATEMTSIQLGVEFDQTIESKNRDRYNSFLIDKSSTGMLREAERLLLSQDDDEIPVNIVGRVIALRSLSNPMEISDTSSREITIQWENDSKKKNTSAHLVAQDYAEAIRAHEKGFHVQVKGTLGNAGSRSVFTSVLDFRVLD